MREKSRPLLLGAMLALIGLPTCEHGEIASGPLVAQRDSVADTVSVRTLSGSAWGRPIRLHEELRIGSLEGSGPDAFGQVWDLAVERDGSILVLDREVPGLLRFSTAGAFLETIGRKGQGPGEYGGGVNGVVVDGSGRIVLSDPSNARIMAFSSDGSFLRDVGRAPGLQSLFGQMLATDDSGRLYVHILTVPLGPDMPHPWPIGAEVRDSDGTVLDTIPPPEAGGVPSDFFGVLHDGSIVAFTADAPVFEVHHPDGRVTRITMPYEGVPYSAKELAAMKGPAAAAAAADGMTKASLPKRKSVYVDAIFDPLGRIWLRRSVASASDVEAAAPPRFQTSILDVVTVDGEYLGVVELPERTMPLVVTATSLYAVQQGRSDEQYVVRYGFKLP